MNSDLGSIGIELDIIEDLCKLSKNIVNNDKWIFGKGDEEKLKLHLQSIKNHADHALRMVNRG